jgi:hypothetical protein
MSLVFCGVLLAALAGCKEPGPFEQAGEEIDEAVDTVRDGKESVANKLDDAADEVREGVNDARKELQQESK